MFGNVVSPPSNSAVQDLKELLSLISDPKKYSQVLKQFEDALAMQAEAVKLQSLSSADLNSKLSEFKNKEADLAKRELALAEKLKAHSQKEADLNERNNSVLKGEKEFKSKKSLLEDDYSKKQSELGSLQKSVSKLQSDASESKAKADQLIKEYEAKIAKLKSAIGE